MKALYIIQKPLETEKAIKLNEKMIYAFYVHPKATKIDVKLALQEMYGREVESVKMMITPAKKRTIRRAIINKRPEQKKALVTFKGKKKLDINKLKEASKK